MFCKAFVAIPVLFLALHIQNCEAQLRPVVVSVSTAQPSVVPVYGIVEWKLNITNYSNPWEAVNITLNLALPPSNNVSKIMGFHYVGDEWRVRAALLSPGTYQYKMDVAWYNDTLHSSSGSVQCDNKEPPQPRSVGLKGFLRPRFNSPPYRTEYDDGTLFTGFGLGDCLNNNLTFPTLNESSGETYLRNLTEYFSDYGEAGFNMFRYSDGNCAFSIVESFDANPGRPTGNKYNETLCLLVDTLFDTLHEHGFRIWNVLLRKESRNPIFPHMNESGTIWHWAQQEALGRYFDYAVARWGAQVDVWSLLNEQRAESSWLAFAADYLRSIDPYKHPISSSWNDHINMTQIEVDSVHWYYSEGTTNTDNATVQLANQELAHQKPVYITESGNEAHNWDPDSHTRMRIRSWTCFFTAMNLLWWNTAGTKNCHPCGGGNMYLGPTERGYQKVLRNFTNHMSDPSVAIINVSASEGVRAYGLVGNPPDNHLQVEQNGAPQEGKMYMAYAHHFFNHTTNITTSLSFQGMSGTCKGTWIYPESGTTVEAIATNMEFVSPQFAIDIALLLLC
eukprot:m.66710 g.66710  ORF g.66710 m.66710 type:complete len:562 (+) comp11827_c0_seq3:83-1768(+)